MKIKLSFLLLLPIVFYFQLSAQTINEQKYKIHIKRTSEKIKIDGILDENTWKIAEKTPPFRQQFPYDTSKAIQQTIARVTFDDEFIYYSFVVDQPRKYAVLSLKRDFPSGGGTDLVVFNIDTFRDKQNGFHFAVNPYGVQREALISNGNIVSNDWDNKWYTAVKNYDDHWVVECAIPFKTIRYKLAENGQNTWNINFFRNNLLLNERSSWAQLPRSGKGTDLAFSGTLVWDDAPPKPGPNVSIIPYSIASVGQDFINEQPLERKANIGFDTKIAVTPSLNLDITINPDFSQVEVDRQVTNLSRFEILFPERRQFFLENNDLFGTFGTDNVTPFFSRRIGITKNPITGNSQQVKILGGARLSGKLTNNWRIGLMSMQTKGTKFDNKIGLAEANYTVGAIQRKLFTRSNISLMVVNKENAIGKLETQQAVDSLKFHRIVGLDYNMASRNGYWRNKLFYHQSFTPSTLKDQNSAGIIILKDSPTWFISSGSTYVGENYFAPVGYVPRQNFLRNESNFGYTFYPKSTKINRVLNNFGIGIDWDYFTRKTDFKTIDYDFTPLFFMFQFTNNANLTLFPYRFAYTYLFSDFDPTNTGSKPLTKNQGFAYQQTRFNFQSNTNKPFFFNISGRGGEYYNGHFVSFGSTINYRFIPYALLSVDITNSRIKLPKPYNSAVLWLVSPRAEITFNKNVFWTTFVQYNNQANNFNINSRFQWRFKPASDFFIVYTDNYFATDPEILEKPYNLGLLNSKSRALVMKLTYWFNI
jgi:hypothetical protein